MMKTITLVPSPTITPIQTNSIGYNPATFTSPTAPILNPGDMFVLQLTGETPNLGQIGVLWPWQPDTDWPSSLGSLDSSGGMTILQVYTGTAPIDVTQGRGIILATGVLPGGGVNPYGAYHPCRWIPPAAPVPLPAAGLGLLEYLVLQSHTTKVPVADWRVDFKVVSYLSQQPIDIEPVLTKLPPMICLSDDKSAFIARKLNGYVLQAPPPAKYWFDPFAVGGVQPNINWIVAVLEPGQPAVKAVGMDIVWAFAINANDQNSLDKAIRACFVPA